MIGVREHVHLAALPPGDSFGASTGVGADRKANQPTRPHRTTLYSGAG